MTCRSGYSCLDKETVTSSFLSLSLSSSLSPSPSCFYSVHLLWTQIVSVPLVLAASLSIAVSYNDFSPMSMCPITVTPHLSLSPLALSLSFSISLNYKFTVSRSKQGVLKLLIIIPGHEMVGRLGGGHIAAEVLQHTM